MYRDDEFDWIMAEAKVVTNSRALKDMMTEMIAGRYWINHLRAAAEPIL